MPNLNTTTLSTELMVPSLRELARRGPQAEQRARESGLAILAAHGFAAESFAALADRIPLHTAVALLDNAIEVTGDGAFALRAGVGMEPSDYGLFQLLTGSAPTLRASIQLATRYMPLINDGATLSLVVQGDQAIWQHKPLHRTCSSPAADDYLVAAFLACAQHMLGFAAPPLEVWMMQAQPDHLGSHEQVFAATTHFGKHCNAIVLPRAALDLPLVTASAPMLRVLERYAQESPPRIKHSSPFLSRVRDSLLSHLERGAPLADIAHGLNLSASSLQRRLRALGTSHSEVLDDLRQERAVQLIADLELNISEIAFRLGFAHRTAFHRAFRRWLGCSPSEYRAGIRRGEFYQFYRGR